MRALVRAAVTAAFCLAAVVLGDLRPASAARQCAPLPLFERAIAEQYQEEKTAVAAADGNGGAQFLIIIYENPTSGSWTQLVVNNRGIACLMASGQGGIRRVTPAVPPGGNRTIPTLPHKRGEGESSALDTAPTLTDEHKRFIKGVLTVRDAQGKVRQSPLPMPLAGGQSAPRV